MKAVRHLTEETYFKHYEGQEPFIFISYAHSDSAEVMRVITDMHSRGFRLWYDEGIEVGSEWQECIASHLMEADLMIAFISNAYMASDNCRKEMSYALSKKKKVINIFLEETALTPGMELQLGNIFAIMKYTYPSEGYFYSKLYGAELLGGNYGCTDTAVNVTRKNEREAVKLKKEKEKKKQIEAKKQAPKKPKKKWVVPVVTIIVLMALVIAGAIVGYFTGYLQRFTTQTVKPQTVAGDTVAEFKNSVVEAAAREYTGKSLGDITVSDLTGLTSLYIAGDRYWFTEPLSGVSAESADTETAVRDPDGNAVTVSRGEMTDFTDFKYFPSLTTLWVQFENISSMESMPACRIENLNVAGNRITSLSSVCNLSKLESLRTDGCPLSDVLTLEQCIDLRELSLRGSDVSDLSKLKNLTKLDAVSLSGCTLSELEPVLGNHYLTSLTLEDCDLRGSFLMSFAREWRITSLSLTGCKLDSLSNAGDFTALTELTIKSCQGMTDWSGLLSFPALKTLHTDSATAEQLSGLAGTAGFEISVDK